MESQPQNPEFRINPENFHPCSDTKVKPQSRTVSQSKMSDRGAKPQDSK